MYIIKGEIQKLKQYNNYLPKVYHSGGDGLIDRPSQFMGCGDSLNARDIIV